MCCLTVLSFLAAGTALADDSAASNAAPSPTPAVKHHKKKASAQAAPTATVQVTPVVTSSAAPGSKKASGLKKPLVKEKVLAAPPPADDLLVEGNKAFDAGEWSKAAAAFRAYTDKHGKIPEVLKKLYLAEFREGESLIGEARDGFRLDEKTIPMDGETHNLMVYGKKEPARSAHPFTISLAILTPAVLGIDLGYTIAAHWNVGLGVGLIGFNPRLKYYLAGDVSSFFLTGGYASFNTGTLSINVNSGNGNNGSGSLTGDFTYLGFGHSFVGSDGSFLEAEFDLGGANLSGQGTGGNNNGSGSGNFNYNGVFGMLGFRLGFAI